MAEIKDVKVIEHWKLSVEYDDGLEGEISLSHLSGKPEYKSLSNYDYFKSVCFDDESGDLIWDNGISLCKNAIYKQLELKRLAKSLKIDLDKLDE